MRFLPPLALIVLTACGGSDRVITPPRVAGIGPIYRAAPLPGETGTVVAVYFTLADEESSPVDVAVEVSRDGSTFTALGQAQSGDAAPGSDGLQGLTSRATGFLHRLRWKPPADLGADEEVRLRFTPSEQALMDSSTTIPAQVGEAVQSPPFHLSALAEEPR